MSPTTPDAPDVVRVVVPLRSFAGAKERLAPRFSPDDRAALAQELAERVTRAARPNSVIIVTAAPEVVAWARAAGHDICDDPGSLNEAAAAGVAQALAAGATRIVLAHGDLPRARSFTTVLEAPPDHVVLVPDRHRDGTPVISLPASSAFRFSYGPGSFARHCAEAKRIGAQLTIVDDTDLGFDVDVPSDIDALHDPMFP